MGCIVKILKVITHRKPGKAFGYAWRRDYGTLGRLTSSQTGTLS